MAAKAASQPVDDLIVVVRWLAVSWAVFAVDALLTVWRWGGSHLGEAGVLGALAGLRPREVRGLVGILAAPFLHADAGHLLANSLALLLCGWLALRAGRGPVAVAVLFAVLCSGGLTWAVGTPGTIHIGASGVVFGLVGFLLANALWRKGCLPVLVAVPVILIYGASLADILPWHAPDGMSWEMHLGGCIGGVCASWGTRRAA